MRTPHSERPAPTINAMSTRGKRMFQMIFSVFPSQAIWKMSFPDILLTRILPISEADTLTAPMVVEMVTAITISVITSASVSQKRPFPEFPVPFIYSSYYNKEGELLHSPVSFPDVLRICPDITALRLLLQRLHFRHFPAYHCNIRRRFFLL